MIHIDRSAIRSDLRRNGVWLAFCLIVCGLIGARTQGSSILFALPFLAAAGLAVRYAWAGRLGFGKV